MEHDNEGLLHRLQRPTHPVDVVIDTDTYNEVDDQFALAFLIKSPEKFRLKAINAAPFFNKRSDSPGDGMEKSYAEIMKILSLMDRNDLKKKVIKGSAAFLPSETEPVNSPAAQELAELASGYTEQHPLYIIAIGAITNIASAILLRPEIINRIVIIWLGGHSHSWPHTAEFNMRQDVAAARIVFGCRAALVQLPCMGVVSSFTTSGPELEYWLKGKNELCNYLVENTSHQALEDQKIPTWTRVIWDVCAVAWILDGGFMEDYLCPSPIPQYDNRYIFDPSRHLIRCVSYVHRDKLFYALFKKLTE